jgi:hypothetical protein
MHSIFFFSILIFDINNGELLGTTWERKEIKKECNEGREKEDFA